MERLFMELKEKIIKYIHENTTDGFHDASLIGVDINPELRTINLKIEHMRKIRNTDICIISKFFFKDISRVDLVNLVKEFGVDDDIGDFDVSFKNSDLLITITGTKGWVFSFAARSCDIAEEFLFNE